MLCKWVGPTGVNTLELSGVIFKAGVKNTVSTTMLPEQLNKALQEGASKREIDKYV